MDEDPKLVMLPTSISLKIGDKKMAENVMRVCFFLGWKGFDRLICKDSGLLIGKSGRIYPNLKHMDQLYIFKAEKASFVLYGVG